MYAGVLYKKMTFNYNVLLYFWRFQMTRSKSHLGDESEQRFIYALTTRTSSTPSWFKGIKKAGPGHDLKGIDAFVFICRTDDPKPMSVPVQIKRSVKNIHKFSKTHPEAARLGMPVIVIPPEITDEEIRIKTYKVVEHCLTLPRDHFAKYLHLGSGRRKKPARELLREIRNGRRKK